MQDTALTVDPKPQGSAGHDILAEGPIGLSAACRAVPAVDGKHPAPTTLWRWCRVGVNGVRLQYAKVGRRIVTSKPAIARFAAALAAADGEVGGGNRIQDPSPGRNPSLREKQIASAAATLAAAGI